MKKIIRIVPVIILIITLFASCGNGGLSGTYVAKNDAAKQSMYAKFIFKGGKVRVVMGAMGIEMPVGLEYGFKREGDKVSIELGVPGVASLGGIELNYNEKTDELHLLFGGEVGTTLNEYAPVWGKEGSFDPNNPFPQKDKKDGQHESSTNTGNIKDSDASNKPVITGTFTYSGGNVAKKLDESFNKVDLEGDYKTDFVFSTDYFNNPASVYNHDMAIMSLQLAMAAYGLHNKTYTSGQKSDNIKQLFRDMNFENEKITSYGYGENPEANSIAVNFAYKSLDNDAELLIIAVRGGEYKAEWGGNFYVGNGDVHKGFDIAKEKILTDYLEEYLSKNSSLSGKTVKLWITGFSRGAAVANLLSAFFTDVANTSGFYQSKTVKIQLQKDNIYAYCFATPNNSKKAKRDGYENIFNIINPFDIVPRLPIWEFKKYGRERPLPIPTDPQYINYTNKMLFTLDKMNSNSTFKSNDYYINKFKFHKGNIGHFYASILSLIPMVDDAIYDIGRHDEDKNMYSFVNDLCITILPKIMGTQKTYVEKKQNNVVNALSKSEKNWLDLGLIFWCFKDALDDAIINRDYIATLGPSDDHLKKLFSGDGNVGNLQIKDRFPAVYNFNEGAFDLNFNDGYDKIKIEENLKTRREAVKVGANEAKHNLYALVSAHYPELYLAWLKSLPAEYFQ